MSKFKTLLDGLIFPEGPRWHNGRLWFSDMHDRKVLAVNMDGDVETMAETPYDCSGLGWTPEGDLLIVSMEDRSLLRQKGDKLLKVADLSDIATFHCNDMVVDAKGRAYIGNFGFDLHCDDPQPAPAKLAFVDESGKSSVAADDLKFPNGSVITPDGKTLIVGESWGAKLTAFDIADDGTLSGRRIWAETRPAVPDGICLDTDGGIWIASPTTQDVRRYKEGGEMTDCLSVATNAFACMLGGPDGNTLFVLTAEDSDPRKLKGRRTGKIEMTEVTYPHAGLP